MRRRATLASMMACYYDIMMPYAYAADEMRMLRRVLLAPPPLPLPS